MNLPIGLSGKNILSAKNILSGKNISMFLRAVREVLTRVGVLNSKRLDRQEEEDLMFDGKVREREREGRVL